MSRGGGDRAMLDGDAWARWRKRAWLFAAPLGAIAMIALFQRVSAPRGEGGGTGTAAAAAPASGSAELAALRRQVEQLEVQVASQRRAQLAIDRATAVPQDAVEPRRGDPDARAEADRQRRVYVAGVDDGFRREPVDPQWSAATASIVSQAIAASDELRGLSRGVECRARTCRIDVADDGSRRMRHLVVKLAQRLGRELPSAVYDHVDDTGGGGGALLRLYLSRPE
jgi:hypothetical protein